MYRLVARLVGHISREYAEEQETRLTDRLE